MDDLGNRIGTVEQRDANHTYAVDSLTNRYTAIDAAPIAHDPAGNLTRDRQDYRYEYDYENRIARIYTLSGETQITVASFDYDALGHRVRKIDAVAGTTTLYYNDPEWRVLAEYNGTGAVQRTFVWGNYIDEALRMRAGESDYYYLHDHLYSPAVLIGYESGQWRPVERYEYDAYGTARVMDPSFGTRAATQYGVTTLFTGRTLDTLDSANLKIMYYRHRYTDPFVGRFLQQDPIRYVDSMNLYEYVKSRPVTYYDPQGLKGVIDTIGDILDRREIAQGILVYKNAEYAGHSGLLVNGSDIDFGPNGLNPFFTEGIVPWPQGGPGRNSDNEQIAYYTFTTFLRNSGTLYKTKICCKNVTLQQVNQCIKWKGWEWNDTTYKFLSRNCESFVSDVLSSCCLVKAFFATLHPVPTQTQQ